MGNQPSKTPPPGSAGTGGGASPVTGPTHGHSLSHSQSTTSRPHNHSHHRQRRSNTTVPIPHHQGAATTAAAADDSSSPQSPSLSGAGSPLSSGRPTPVSTLSPGSSIRSTQKYHPYYHQRNASAGLMGNSQSAEAAATAAAAGAGPGSSSSSSRVSKRHHGQQQASGAPKGGAGWDVHSSPMQVPVGGQHAAAQEAAARTAAEGRTDNQRGAREPDIDPPPAGSPLQDDEYAPASNLNFPPRLPLPIQEEVYTPGSPIISPDELSAALNDDPDAVGLGPHRTSLLSHTTAEEDDEIDLEGGVVDRGRTVPTTIQWRGKAEKVYVTGSFANWGRKFRMHRDPKDSTLLSTKLDLLPGTHHVKFIVDNDMRLSTDLPTAVDYTNVLVNYVEVSADDIPTEEAPPEQHPTDIHPPLLLPSGVEHTDWQDKADETSDKQHPDRKYLPRAHVFYSDVVPQYLPDMDQDEGTNRFRRSTNNASDIPPPPSLPLFLGKSILNGTTPMKDDSSVLNMPNHTVLNHLATSSIKNDVLATSVTTRYRRKYVTTITYRPTREDD